MIKINLLPSDMAGRRAGSGAKKKPKGSGAATPYVLGLALLFGGATFGGWTLYSRHANSQERLQGVKTKLAKLDAEVKRRNAEYLAQNAEAQEIEEKFVVVQALNPRNRLFWSEKLNQLALAKTKAAVFLTNIQMDEIIEEQETQESVARRHAYEEKQKARTKDGKAPSTPAEPPPKVIKIPVIHQTLTVDAIAYGQNSPQRLQQITLFMEALKRLDWIRASGEKTTFLSGFLPEFLVLPHKVARVGEVDVLQFGFKLKAAPQMSDPPKPAPGAPALPGNPAV